MTEFALILGVIGCGLGFALALARWGVPNDRVAVEVRRLAEAVVRTSTVFLHRGLGRTAAAAVVIALVALIGRLVLDTASDSLRFGSFAAVGVMIGAGVGVACGYVALRHTLRASLCALSAAGVSTDATLKTAMRAGGAVGLVVECAGQLGGLLAIAAVAAWHRLAGVELTLPNLMRDLTGVLSGYALGALVAALAFQRAGVLFQCGVNVGSDSYGGFSKTDPRNPAAVATVAAEHVGTASLRALNGLSCNATCTFAAFFALSVVSSRIPGGLSTGIVLLPFVVRTFGVVASGHGVFAARTEESGNPALAFWRGHVATLVIGLAGVVGSSLWLAGDSKWFSVFSVGTLGLLGATVALHASSFGLGRRSRWTREFNERTTAADAFVLSMSLSRGLLQLSGPTLAVAATSAAVFALGEYNGLPGGGLVALAISLMALSALSPYFAGVGSACSILRSARKMGQLSECPEETSRRLLKLTEGARQARVPTHHYFWQLGIGSVLSLALSVTGQHSETTSTGATSGALLFGCLLGIALVLAYSGGVMAAATRAARAILQELGRQLGGFPKEGGQPLLPVGFTPSYRSLVEVAEKSALEGSPAWLLLGLVSPLLAVGVLMVTWGPDNASTLGGLSIGMLSAASVAFCLASLGEAVWALISARRGLDPTVPENKAEWCGPALARVLADAVAPAADQIPRAAVLVILTVLPFAP